ncbi:MAG: DUF5615 family PIN-like protein [Planctomycetes bacterium]|nr:DUF5615 family PIN-like protein [Planctomycetota bacterium]
MSLRLYMDEHVPKAISDGLRQRGIDVLMVQDDGRAGIDDPSLLDRATELERVLFTRDTDLLKEASRRQSAGQAFCGVIYTHPLRLTISQCLQELELLAEACEPDELSSRVEYLPLG